MEYPEQKLGQDPDEINLMQYFEVIYKRKFLIIAIFLIAVIATAIISFRMPPVYRVMALVSPGWIDTDSSGRAIYVDSAENIKSLIEGDAFGAKIRKALKLDPLLYPHLEFDVKLARNTEALSVSYDTKDPAEGKAIVGELLKQLTEYYSGRTDTRSKSIDTSIEILKHQNESNQNRKIRIVNEKKKIMSDMELLRDKEKLLKVTEKYLTNQLKGVEENTKTIMQERSEMLKKGEKVDSVALLLYSNTVQQNISYIDRLNSDLERNRLDQESTKNALSRAEIELKNKDTESKDVDTDIMTNLDKIRNLELDKVRIEGFKIIQEPVSSIRPVKPNKKMNIAIAGVTSIFLGIFLAFFLEFIKKAKAYTDDKDRKE
jgi:uncharacterized protein involved in exopolysaccharide biosynthesis